MEETIRLIFEKIREYNRIIIARHIRPDGDAVGSSHGLKELIKASFPEKEVYVINSDVSFESDYIDADDADIDEALYADALCIAIDTATTERISNPKYSLCRELIKIDHHIECESFGDISWVDDARASASEMVAELYDTCRDGLTLNKKAAAAIFIGIVTDTGRFRFSSTSGKTLRLASILLDCGIDTEKIFTSLYLGSSDIQKMKCRLFLKSKQTEHGVSYYIAKKLYMKRHGFVPDLVGKQVNILDSTEGSMIWASFTQTDDGFRVSLRSRFIPINALAEKYGGGGHAHAAGASCRNMKQVRELLAEADRMLDGFRAENGGLK